jgi:hypothetical protein
MAGINIQTKLFQINGRTILRLPEEESAMFPSRSQVMVNAKLNGSIFKTVLEPDGRWSHWIEITSAMQKDLNVKSGDTVTFEADYTKDWIEPIIPKDLKEALVAAPEIYTLWAAVTPMARWEWVRWVNATKDPETRQRRIRVSLSKLKGGLKRPCCFNRAMCTDPYVSKGGKLIIAGDL